MNRTHARGFSLMELLVVVMIIAILAMIAYPSYTEYATRTKRSLAASLLTQVANKQEQYYLDNKQYADDLAVDLNYPADPFYVDENGSKYAATQVGVIYQITLNRDSVSSYTLSAVPQGAQAEQDTKCGTLSLTNTGVKGETGTGGVSDCW